MLEDKDKNVFLTIVHGEQENDDELNVDFGVIGKQLKRFFALWLCLALALGCLSGASGLLLQRVLGEHKAKAMIRFSDTTYDITKIKSPAVIGEAIQRMGLNILDMEQYQKAVEISGVIPSSSYQELSMYYDLLNNNTTTDSLSVIRTLLGSSYSVSRYIVSFSYLDAKLSQEDGVAFLNALLLAYQRYCAKVYNYNLSMGNPLSAVDYQEYDYAEAANIFAGTLDSITSYLSNLESSAGNFRSTKTGLTFQDLHRTANLLKGIDLDRLSSYIVIHSVSEHDAETEVSYYRWRIENLEQQRTVQRTRFASLTDSINNYRKDDIIIMNGINGNSVVSSPENVNANYDSMIQEKLDAQASIASYTRSISFYESVIEGFLNAETSSRPEDIQVVKEYLEHLNEEVNELIRNITLTADEYYDRVAFTDEVRVLIPSMVEAEPLVSMTTVKVVAAIEALLFLGYLCWAFVLGIRETNASKKERETTVAAS